MMRLLKRYGTWLLSAACPLVSGCVTIESPNLAGGPAQPQAFGVTAWHNPNGAFPGGMTAGCPAVQVQCHQYPAAPAEPQAQTQVPAPTPAIGRTPPRLQGPVPLESDGSNNDDVPPAVTVPNLDAPTRGASAKKSTGAATAAMTPRAN